MDHASVSLPAIAQQSCFPRSSPGRRPVINDQGRVLTDVNFYLISRIHSPQGFDSNRVIFSRRKKADQSLP